MKNLTNLELLMEYMEQNQYFIGNDLLAKYNELLQKEKKEQLTLTDVVATLPNINSNLFKNWLKVNKYAETMNRLVYSKKDWDYDIDVLYRAFTNEIEFSN